MGVVLHCLYVSLWWPRRAMYITDFTTNFEFITNFQFGLSCYQFWIPIRKFLVFQYEHLIFLLLQVDFFFSNFDISHYYLYNHSSLGLHSLVPLQVWKGCQGILDDLYTIAGLTESVCTWPIYLIWACETNNWVYFSHFCSLNDRTFSPVVIGLKMEIQCRPLSATMISPLWLTATPQGQFIPLMVLIGVPSFSTGS